jgi:hypothetical protein
MREKGIYRTVDVLCRITETCSGCVDMGVAVNARRRPGPAGMGSAIRRVAVALVAMYTHERCIPGRCGSEVQLWI